MIGALLMRWGARRGWDAFNRGDLAYFRRYYGSGVVMDAPGTPPIGGRFIGAGEVEAAYQRWTQSLAWFRVTPIHIALSNPWALTLTNTVITEYRLEGKGHDGKTFATTAIDVSEMRRGKLVANRTYVFDLAAMEAVERPLPLPAAA